jgi:hypothetical protein
MHCQMSSFKTCPYCFKSIPIVSRNGIGSKITAHLTVCPRNVNRDRHSDELYSSVNHIANSVPLLPTPPELIPIQVESADVRMDSKTIVVYKHRKLDFVDVICKECFMKDNLIVHFEHRSSLAYHLLHSHLDKFFIESEMLSTQVLQNSKFQHIPPSRHPSDDEQ